MRIRRSTARRLTTTGALLVMALFLGTPDASAGGPTSVIVTSPESAETASLYYADEEYDRLETLLGRNTEGTREHPPGLEVGTGRQINVTWLIHDVSPWRVDRVYPDGKGPVWIHTSTDLESLSGTWHKADRPGALRALLTSLHVLGKQSDDGRAGIPPSASFRVRTAAEPPVPAAKPAPDTGWGWPWAIPSAAAGALAGATATLYHRRRVAAA
ncbi:hypothetical protein [Streptomyces spectabilis]|uniref:Uncharacterized protein n=1 Tax=Streptomyces spectabilis TaxID=68270 RepID=A0A516RCC3_STRST|nr:hypothetical protein [Streptomyces spectabilis]QDQ13306.1 hypothetical protein FH965_24310 [Streptomyces spectabilis]